MVNTSAIRKPYVDDLSTAAAERPNGHGAALLDALSERGRESGCDSIDVDYIAAAVISPDDVAAARTVLHGLRHRGSSSVHFKREKDSMRRAFLERAARTGVQTLIYVMKGQPDKVARPACLEALIDDLCAAEAGRLVIEQDDSLARADRRIIAARIRKHGTADLAYLHMKRHEEPLLWVSDAVAWCHQKGGPWIAWAAPLVAEVRTP